MSDGDLDKKNSIRMMGFWDFQVYYWRTDNTNFQPIGDTHKGYRRGQFGEKFAGDLTACMVFPSVGSKSTPYFVYLFNMRKYCFRPVRGVDDCLEWRQNTQLFGYKGEDDNESKDGSEAPEPGVQVIPTQNRGRIASKIENYLLLLSFIVFLI